ncbi:CrcB family protein [Actinotalea sp. AC32]|nr:CrcB family protein [Actinotalea sp. AC32]
MSSETSRRPPHLRPGLVALVAAGGAAGSAARHGVSAWIGSSDGWPTATFVENLVGAFLLGLLLEALVRRGPETDGARRLRLALGTGLLGGFTTFSTLAIEVERLVVDGRLGLGLAYGVVSVVAGAGAALAGVVVGTRRGERRDAGRTRPPRTTTPGGGAR